MAITYCHISSFVLLLGRGTLHIHFSPVLKHEFYQQLGGFTDLTGKLTMYFNNENIWEIMFLIMAYSQEWSSVLPWNVSFGKQVPWKRYPSPLLQWLLLNTFILPSSAHLQGWNKQKILLFYGLFYKLEHAFPIFSKYICYPDKYIRNAQLHSFSAVLPEALAWIFLLYLKNNENVRKTSVSMPVEKMLKAKNVQKDSIKQAFTSAGSK